MMTKATFAVSPLILLLTLAGCVREPKIEVVAGVDVCSECHMVIDQVNQAAGFVRGN